MPRRNCPASRAPGEPLNHHQGAQTTAAVPRHLDGDKIRRLRSLQGAVSAIDAALRAALFRPGRDPVPAPAEPAGDPDARGRADCVCAEGPEGCN